MRRRSLIAAVCFPFLAVAVNLSSSPASAQAPPATDIVLVDIERNADGSPALGAVSQVTDRDGYDNQPAFSADGETIYYTAMSYTSKKDTSIDDLQADIWAFDIASGERRPVLVSTESEYSPTPMPVTTPGGNALSVVRVEADDRQRLWRLPLDGGKPSLILESIEPVGYHAWSTDGSDLVLFVLGEPHRLVRVGKVELSAKAQYVAEDIGRSLHRIPGDDAFSFVANGEAGQKMLQRLDRQSGDISTVIALRGDGEDVTWSPDGMVWMADRKALYRYCPACGGDEWWPVGELQDLSGSITRLAFDPSGRRLALVVDR